MAKVNITELRQNLHAYLARITRGGEIAVSVHGKIIARIVPEKGSAQEARERLKALRGKIWIGDVIKPTGEAWEADR